MSKQQKLPTEDPALLTPPGDPAVPAPRTTELVHEKDQTEDALEKLKALVFNMKPEVQEELARLGVTLPAGDISAAVQGRFKWGLRCTKCNCVALYFVGDKFVDLTTHTEYDEPPTHLTIQQLPWTQRLPADQIDRSNPRCQSCGVPVEKESENKFRFVRRLVQVDHFIGSRDLSFSKKRLAELKRQIDSGPVDSFTDAAGRIVQINDQMRRSFESISSWLGKNMPGALQDIEAVDQAFAAQGGILGGLQQEARRR